jgi:hypothetical protein
MGPTMEKESNMKGLSHWVIARWVMLVTYGTKRKKMKVINKPSPPPNRIGVGSTHKKYTLYLSSFALI